MDPGYVLVYSHDKVYRKLFVANLLARGYPTIEAGSWQECEAVADVVHPSLIILCRVPVLIEKDFQDVRNCDALRDVPLIAVSTEPIYLEWIERYAIAEQTVDPGDILKLIELAKPYLPMIEG